MKSGGGQSGGPRKDGGWMIVQEAAPFLKSEKWAADAPMAPTACKVQLNAAARDGGVEGADGTGE